MKRSFKKQYFVITLVLMGFMSLKGFSVQESAEITATIPEKSSTAHESVVPDHQKILTRLPSAEKINDSTSEVKIPSTSLIRQEVQQNPHTTPPSVIGFSIEMARKMKVALESEEQTDALIQEFRECVLSESEEIPVTIKAMCLRYVKYLSHFRSKFEGEYQKLFEDADGDVKRLTR